MFIKQTQIVSIGFGAIVQTAKNNLSSLLYTGISPCGGHVRRKIAVRLFGPRIKQSKNPAFWSTGGGKCNIVGAEIIVITAARTPRTFIC